MPPSVRTSLFACTPCMLSLVLGFMKSDFTRRTGVEHYCIGRTKQTVPICCRVAVCGIDLPDSRRFHGLWSKRSSLLIMATMQDSSTVSPAVFCYEVCGEKIPRRNTNNVTRSLQGTLECRRSCLQRRTLYRPSRLQTFSWFMSAKSYALVHTSGKTVLLKIMISRSICLLYVRLLHTLLSPPNGTYHISAC